MQHIAIQIHSPRAKPDRVFGGPAARLGIIIAGPKPGQAGIAIVNATGKPKRLEGRRNGDGENRRR